MTTKPKGWTLAKIKAANKKAGRFYFSPETIRFFKSRPSDKIHQGPGGVFFVDSVQPPHGERYYTVRPFDPETGEIPLKVGNDFETSEKAHTFAEQQAQGAA